jgi:hypothetical protein
MRASKLFKLAKVGWRQRVMQFRVFARKGDNDRVLAIVINPPNPPFAHDYSVVAIEAAVDDPLGNHNHHVIGGYDTKREAKLSADSFAKMWQKRAKVAQASDCPCGEIFKDFAQAMID